MSRYHRLGRWAKQYRTHISVGSTLLVLCVVLPATVVLFPDSNLWLAVLFVLLALIDQVRDLIDQVEDDYEDEVK